MPPQLPLLHNLFAAKAAVGNHQHGAPLPTTGVSSRGRAQDADKKNSKQAEGQIQQRDLQDAKTLMIRNIPVHYTQDMLLKEWPNDSGAYDFLYLPICIKRKRNASFCFVNFNSKEISLDFYKTWHKQRLQHFNTSKPLDISPADVQGRDENLLQTVRNKTFRIKNIHFQPAVFDGPQRMNLKDFLAELDARATANRAVNDNQTPS